MKKLEKLISVKACTERIELDIFEIEKINSNYKILIENDKDNYQYCTIRIYYKDELINVIYNSIDSIMMYLCGFKRGLQFSLIK